MTEMKQNVREKASLMEELLDLLNQQKILEKEVFDLKIVAHNEQADVEALEGFSMKSLLLQITGKKEERMDLERQEARAAKARYDLAAVRLESIRIRINEIDERLLELDGCENQLCEAFQEDPCPSEHNAASALDSVWKSGIEMKAAAEELLNRLQAMAERFDSGQGIMASPGQLLYIENQAQDQLNTLNAQLHPLCVALSDLGFDLNAQDLQKYETEYLRQLLTPELITTRSEKVRVSTMQVIWQWNSLQPKLKEQRDRAMIAWMQAMCQ